MTIESTPVTANPRLGIVDRVERLSTTRRFPLLLAGIVVLLHLPAFFLKIFDNDEA